VLFSIHHFRQFGSISLGLYSTIQEGFILLSGEITAFGEIFPPRQVFLLARQGIFHAALGSFFNTTELQQGFRPWNNASGWTLFNWSLDVKVCNYPAAFGG